MTKSAANRSNRAQSAQKAHFSWFFTRVTFACSAEVRRAEKMPQTALPLQPVGGRSAEHQLSLIMRRMVQLTARQRVPIDGPIEAVGPMSQVG